MRSLVWVGVVAVLTWFALMVFAVRGTSFKVMDLGQHFEAGRMWEEGERSRLYHGNALGDRMQDWRRAESPQQVLDKVEDFNYVYAPVLAWCSSWLMGLGYKGWIIAWWVVMWGSYLGALWIILKSTPSEMRSSFFWLLALGFPSFAYVLILDQNSTLTLLILASAALLMNRGQLFASGLVLSCAFYKPQIFPYLGLLLLIAAPWRIAAGLAAGGIGWLLAGLLLCGLEVHLEWIDRLREMAAGRQFELPGLNKSWRGFLLAMEIPIPRMMLDLFLQAGAVAGVVALGIWLRKQAWPPSHVLWVGVTAWLVLSPYVPYYEILLGVGWWLIVFRTLPDRTWAWCALFSFWLAAFPGRMLEVPFAPWMLTAWLFGSLYLMQNEKVSSIEDDELGHLKDV